MSRLDTIEVSEVTGELAATFNSIKKGMGRVPNALATLGTNSPELLAQVLQLNGMLQTQSALSKRQLEAINLAVSEDSGCDYCVAAHTITPAARPRATRSRSSSANSCLTAFSGTVR